MEYVVMPESKTINLAPATKNRRNIAERPDYLGDCKILSAAR